MTCKDICELMPDLAFGVSSPSAETSQHLRSCPECAGKLEEIRKTMRLLDEWQAPEPSPYFDTRLEARVREQADRPSFRAWLAWIRRPALALVAAALVAVGAIVINRPTSRVELVNFQPGTAVGDLQQLDKNHDLYSESDFDLLDDLQIQENVNAN